MFAWCRSITTRSASLPGAMQSASMRMARAPVEHAARRISRASHEAASSSRSFCSTAARYISRNMLSALLLAGPSVPMARGIFRRRNSLTGAMPLASFAFEAGHVTAYRPRRAKMSMSVSSSHTQWNPPPPCSKSPFSSKSCVGVRPWRSMHSSTSRFVSELCVKNGSLYSSTSIFMNMSRSGFAVYSAWMPGM